MNTYRNPNALKLAAREHRWQLQLCESPPALKAYSKGRIMAVAQVSFEHMHKLVQEGLAFHRAPVRKLNQARNRRRVKV